MLDRLNDGVLADAHGAAEHQRVVDLVLGALHPVREPCDDVLKVIREYLLHEIEPEIGLVRIAVLDCRRAIEIETG